MAEADPAIATGTSLPVEETQAKPRRKWLRLVLMLIVPVLLVSGAFAYWQSLQGKVSTDNAYVKQDMVAISSEVGGKIVEAFVKDGDTVAAGDRVVVI